MKYCYTNERKLVGRAAEIKAYTTCVIAVIRNEPVNTCSTPGRNVSTRVSELMCFYKPAKCNELAADKK